MLGIQCFNSEDDFKMWSDETVEFNLRWLNEELEIPLDEITLREDVWAGGGNLGPSIEYFIGGLELGNMVFMQFKTFPDGHREPLDVKVIDVGIGLERIPWLVNGSPTSYMDVFHNAITYFTSKVKVDLRSDVWEKFGKYSCILNVDEVDDVDATWKEIADRIGMDKDELRAGIDEVREVYIICDHTRTILMAIEDGSLPSNVGGASNVRNILRRVFATLHKRGWWDDLGMDGLIDLFQSHKKDLEPIYGAFKEYKSFRPIIEIEYERWLSTDDAQRQKLEKLLKKNKNVLTIDDWVVCITSWGIPADKVAEVSGTPVPGNLYYEIAERQERVAKAAATVLYNTGSFPPTAELFYKGGEEALSFDSKVVTVLEDIMNKNSRTILILEGSCFYPTSGGQEHDVGTITVCGEEYKIVNAEKVGKCILHYLDRPVEGNNLKYEGQACTGQVDVARRAQLRNHHTATHIMYAAARRTLGPHVWQHGAKKTTEMAHLDITHYKSLSHEEEKSIEEEANRIVGSCKDIRKYHMPKDEAEKQFGFSLYQGGVVPGNTLRVVDITETDQEACCGTHCDNTAEVGFIRIVKTARISDGIVRLYYVASERALQQVLKEKDILHELCSSWNVSQNEIVPTATRFFDGYKKYGDKVKKQSQEVLGLTIRCMLLEEPSNLVIRSDMPDPTLLISIVPGCAEKLKASGKGVIFVGKTFLYGLLGNPKAFDTAPLADMITKAAAGGKAKLITKNSVKAASADKKVKKKIDIKDVAEITCFGMPCQQSDVMDLLTGAGFVEFIA
eukprot:GFYU01004295.1.p2 GENE.GFYU01004295.1~~GFYU01004295.1.p2  ORF type:complete len:891 (-),score=379.12 GFYU01004295.1:90-2453(-)